MAFFKYSMTKIKTSGFLIGIFLCISSSFADTGVAIREVTIKELIKKYDCRRYTSDLHKNELCPLWQRVLLLPKSLSAPEDVWQKKKMESEANFIEWLDWEARIRNKIKPRIGMSADYIHRHVMGPPDSINETETSDGKTMQWVYREDSQRRYFYFDESRKLISIQTNR